MILTNKQFIFETNDTVAQCHAATVVMLNDNTVASAWFAGSAEGNNDVSIWFARRVDGAWESPIRLTADDGVPHWNPVLFSSDGVTLALFYKVGEKISDWKTFVMTSVDGGKSWSEAEELVLNDTSGGRGPVKNKPLRLNDGKILAPASTEQGAWRPFVDIFDGDKWYKRSMSVCDNDGLGLIQPTLWTSGEGNIHAMLRSNKGFIYRSDSCDYGESWAECYPTDIPNNNSGIDCVTIEDKLLLVCNPVTKNWGERTPLTVFLSRDNGKTFEKLIDLETEEGEFSYPSIVTKNGVVYIVYTYKRRKIAFCEFKL